MADTPFLAGEGTLWIQPNGPNTKPVYLGCHALGDVEEPLGDLNLVYCPDPALPNKFIVINGYQSAPGPVTTSIDTDMYKTADWLEKVKCPIPIYFGKVTCGRKNSWGAYDRLFVLESGYVTRRGISKFLVKNPDDQENTTQTFDISGTTLLRAFTMQASRVTIADAEDLLGIASSDAGQCAGNCGDVVDVCTNMFIASGTLVGSAGNTADMLVTSDGGATWAPGAGDPFAGGIAIAAVASVASGSGTRVIALRGTTAANENPISYSDDAGVTWTAATLTGSTGKYGLSGKALFALDYYNIWAVLDGGYIYKSEDGGATWEAQSEGDLTANDLYAVDFIDDSVGFAVGASNTILKTVDGGAVWSAVTAPAAQVGVNALSVGVVSKYRVWVGYTDGLWYSHNAGSTWAERNLPVASLSVQSMDWYDVYVGFLVANVSNVGHVLMTLNGGYDWTDISLPTVDDLRDIHVCSPDLVFAVGDASGGTGVLLKLIPG